MMHELKNKMGKLMNFVMLSCEDATLLLTQKQYGSIGILKNFQLQMHLASCKLCRRFNVHNELIHKEWEFFEEENKEMSLEKKSEIEKQIESEIIK